jgi:Putative adhesin
MPSFAMRSIGFAATVAAIALASTSTAVFAQSSDHEWQKVYAVGGGAASLTVETGDSGLEIHTCGDCKEIRVHVESTQNLSEYSIEEHQDGDHVSFRIEEKPHIGFRVQWNESRRTKVSVETPGKLNLDARVEDGNLSARDLTGSLQVHAGDGAVTLDDIKGDVHLVASDGSVTLHNVIGTLDARGSDGSMKIDGQFTKVQLEMSDGNLDFTLAPGSQLTAASSIESSDGRVSIRLPQALSADMDVATGDGHLNCTLPLTMDHYNSRESSGHHLHGHLNSGGVPFSIRASDGNVSITTL